jgi:hypothetical protein
MKTCDFDEDCTESGVNKCVGNICRRTDGTCDHPADCDSWVCGSDHKCVTGTNVALKMSLLNTALNGSSCDAKGGLSCADQCTAVTSGWGQRDCDRYRCSPSVASSISAVLDVTVPKYCTPDRRGNPRGEDRYLDWCPMGSGAGPYGEVKFCSDAKCTGQTATVPCDGEQHTLPFGGNHVYWFCSGNGDRDHTASKTIMRNFGVTLTQETKKQLFKSPQTTCRLKWNFAN